MKNVITEFPVEVIQELKDYVYRLIDPRNGETFYVGRGAGNRVFQHMKGVLNGKDVDEENEKLSTIRDILTSGLEIIHVIHRHGMNKAETIEVEAALIDAYPNATNIVGGFGSNEYGPMNSLEIMQKYSAEEANFKHQIIMITINKSVSHKSIYDATCYAWKVDKNKVNRADYVLSVKQGIIVGAFVADEWKVASKDNFPEFFEDRPKRYAFVGHEADDEIIKLYLRKRVPNKYRKKGAANPIKYSYK